MPWLLFFDGDCGLCNHSIRRLCDWDHEGKIHFAPLQGELASRHGLESFLDGAQASMVLLNEETGERLTQSESLLQILRLLGGPWRLLLVFGWLPLGLRNRLYQCLARNRKRFFRKQKAVCDLPDPVLLSRLRS